MDQEKELVEKYVESFAKLDDMHADKALDPVAWELAVGEPDEYGDKEWRPAATVTEHSALELIYQKLPAKFPRLYERLVLNHRWADVDLESHTLMANPLGTGLDRLFLELSKDKFLWNSLIAKGFVQFARAGGGHYDPVCFDTNAPTKNRDCRIVRIDHEEILCRERVKVLGTIAESFRNLMQQTIEEAAHRRMPT